MKVKLEMEERELKRFLRKKPLIEIKFPTPKSKLFTLGFLVSMVFIIITAVLLQNIGYDKGKEYGYINGYNKGEKVCLQNNYNELTLNQAIAYHIKYNLITIFGWFGLVIGIAWIFHGVGFHIVK